MKFVGVREAQAQLSGLVNQSQKERIVLTRHGQPMAILTGVKGRDFEQVLRDGSRGALRGRAAKQHRRRKVAKR
jgi:prevent-host-death family protein